MRAPPMPETFAPEALEAIRNHMYAEIKAAHPKKALGYLIAPMVADIQVECLAAFLYGVNVPIYRVGIDWKKFKLSGCDGIVFPYAPGWGMGTSDNNDLTRLVFIGHDRSMSISIKPLKKDAFLVHVYKMKRWEGEAGSWNSMHPTLEQARRAYLAGEYVPQGNDPADFIDVDPTVEGFDPTRTNAWGDGRRSWENDPNPGAMWDQYERGSRYPKGSVKDELFWRAREQAQSDERAIREHPPGDMITSIKVEAPTDDITTATVTARPAKWNARSWGWGDEYTYTVTDSEAIAALRLSK